MPEWLNFVNAWLGVPLALAGFGVTFFQIARARTAAEAARDAAQTAAAQVSSNLLLVVLPQLSQVESDLEWAITKGDREVIIHYLGSWRWQAGQVRGHLGTLNQVSKQFAVNIQNSIALAADAKAALQDSSADVLKRSRPVMKAIAQVTGELGVLAASSTVEGVKR